MKAGKNMLAVILIIITAFVLLAAFGAGDNVKGVQKMRYGIDIRGGVEAVFEPQNLNRKATTKELETAREVMEMRLDAQNITDREVTMDKEGGYVIVRFPWKSDEKNFNPEDAISELGQMAELTFRDSKGKVLLKGKNVDSSSVAEDTSTGVSQGYIVKLKFDAEGTKTFAKITGDLVGQPLSIYMDNKEISSPTVEEQINGGEAYINGQKTYDEAKSLSDKINAGALPFSLKTTSFSTISPTLGNNALQVMVFAGLAAFLIVCLFMIFFYKLPGIIACVTLVFQMVLQLLAVSVPQYTLTLPGIAGIILTLGMSVDANIIISERISEELKKGSSALSAVKNGYKRAFTSVLDGNITTAIVAIILMIFGSGTMLSFGYTLLIGVVVNVLIGVTISKQLLLSLSTWKKWNDIKYYRVKKEIKTWKFYQSKKFFALISGAVILIGLIASGVHGVKLDTQFTGGVVMEYKTPKAVDLTKVESAVNKVTNRSVTAQETKSNVDASRSLEITLSGNGGMSPEEQKKVTAAVQGVSADAKKATLSQTYAVEPYIGKKALQNSGIAIGLSFLFIMVYVWIRFKSLSGLPAGATSLLALVHDVIIVFFVFVIAAIPLNDAFVAVVLTIIGYSINDTIVVYDRIRENRQSNSKQGVVQLVNESVSQVLARSVNSSVTTGISVLCILVAAILFQIDSIFEFALPMFFGLISGCYSSVCIASIVWAMWEKRSEKKNIKAK